ncbi:MAG: hypothetical protein H6574_12245 [Lewinellaceae bacterium]|nr:hypothetical protein [Lewinellaceae bacterium]
MKNLTTLFALFIPFLLTAQTNIVWKGGTPGQETKWTEPQNWDNRVPGEFVIAEKPGIFHNPYWMERLKLHLSRSAQAPNSILRKRANWWLTEPIPIARAFPFMGANWSPTVL